MIEKDDYQIVRELLCTYSNVLARPEGPLGHTYLMKYKIKTGDHCPIRQPIQKYLVVDMEAMHKGVDKNAKTRCYWSPWSSSIVMVGKKDESRRLCLNLYTVNHITKKMCTHYHKSTIHSSLCYRARYFCTVDLMSGY